MKKVIRVFRNLLIFIFSLLLSILLSLYIFYEVQEASIRKQNIDLAQNSKVNIIQADSIIVNNGNSSLLLLPVPQQFKMQEGFYQVPETLVYSITDSLKDYMEQLLLMVPGIKPEYTKKEGDILVSYRSDIHDQGYTMNIQPGIISIEYSDLEGLYYSIVTLKVLSRNYNRVIPCVTIEDYPDLRTRGIMLDISRDKVPTLSTLMNLAQLLADLKYNHLELYIEGFSFAYPTYRNLWEGKETPLTGEEIKSLDAFCRNHFIDLVPNQNSLGHMSAWLATDEFASLAECPDGYKMLGLIEMKSTIDPSDPRSLELVTKMTDDLLPSFTSAKMNVNLDEPFELGEGKNKRHARKAGIEGIYLDYTLKIHKMVTDRQKEMLMWGDVIMRHPEVLKKLPKNIILLDWGYEVGYPFENNCKTLSSSGLRFMLCPGTSSWTSITGRTNNMLVNIASAAANAVKYNAEGMLLTDWGDMGHWQYLPVSYAGYSAAAAMSWNSKSIKEFPLAAFLNKYIFKDDRQIMGDLVLDLGRYSQYEEVPIPNMTSTMLSLQFGLQDKIIIHEIYKKINTGLLELMQDIAPEMISMYQEKYITRSPFDFSGLMSFLDEKESLLNNAQLKASDSSMIIDEYRNAILLIRAGASLQLYIANSTELSVHQKKSQLLLIRRQLSDYLAENNRLWLLRNKSGGYDRSTSALNKIIFQIDQKILSLDKPVHQRAILRLKEKLTAASIVLYLKFIN